MTNKFKRKCLQKHYVSSKQEKERYRKTIRRLTSSNRAAIFVSTLCEGSALVNIRRKALLSSIGFRKRITSRSPRVPHVTHVSFASIVHFDLSGDLKFVSRSCLAFSIIPRLIQPRRCHCICLERVFQCFASIKPLGASVRSFRRMLLSNIPWMAPDRMAFMKKLLEQTNKTQMNRCPFNNFFKYCREYKK